MTDSVDRLYEQVIAAKDADPSVSRTARLLRAGRGKMAKKLAEEAVEVVIDAMSGEREAVVRESADLLYNLTVLWVSAGIHPDEVWKEMARRERLFGIAEKNGFRGRYVALLEAISKTAEKKLNRTLPINATGAIGAVLSELGFPWRICRGVAIIGRAVGLVGHIAEEMRNPIAYEIYERAEKEVAENGLAKS